MKQETPEHLKVKPIKKLPVQLINKSGYTLVHPEINVIKLATSNEIGLVARKDGKEIYYDELLVKDIISIKNMGDKCYIELADFEEEISLANRSERHIRSLLNEPVSKIVDDYCIKLKAGKVLIHLYNY